MVKLQKHDKAPAVQLDWLREQVAKLTKLLDDPRPEVYVWRQSYGNVMNNISDFWNE